MLAIAPTHDLQSVARSDFSSALAFALTPIGVFTSHSITLHFLAQLKPSSRHLFSPQLECNLRLCALRPTVSRRKANSSSRNRGTRTSTVLDYQTNLNNRSNELAQNLVTFPHKRTIHNRTKKKKEAQGEGGATRRDLAPISTAKSSSGLTSDGTLWQFAMQCATSW